MYILNKNYVAVFGLYIFGFYSNFTASFQINNLNFQLFSVMYTSLPVIIMAIFDIEMPREVALANPEHYCLGMKDYYFRPNLLILTILEGLISAAACLLVPL
jgi:hypothetical protein